MWRTLARSVIVAAACFATVLVLTLALSSIGAMSPDGRSPDGAYDGSGQH